MPRLSCLVAAGRDALQLAPPSARVDAPEHACAMPIHQPFRKAAPASSV